MGNLIFNGVSTVDLGAVIQTPPVYEFPSKTYEHIKIEGRSGDLLIDNNSYDNVERKYYLALAFLKNSVFVTNARMIVEWLHSVKGYARLEDTYEPEYYRMAAFENPGSLPNLYDEATALEVVFKCKPQRYLKSGEEPILISSSELNETYKITNI